MNGPLVVKATSVYMYGERYAVGSQRGSVPGLTGTLVLWEVDLSARLALAQWAGENDTGVLFLLDMERSQLQSLAKVGIAPPPAPSGRILTPHH